MNTLASMFAGDYQDAQIMAMFVGRDGIRRGTLTPFTLATLGLPAGEFKRIALECAAEQDARRDMTVIEHDVADFEHVVLDNTQDACEHGQLFDWIDNGHPCPECEQQRAEDSAEPADWFGAGFAENH